MNLGKSLKIAMAHKGINQNQLSEASGVSTATLCKITKGRGNLSIDTLDKIAATMDYELLEFLNLGSNRWIIFTNVLFI